MHSCPAVLLTGGVAILPILLFVRHLALTATKPHAGPPVGNTPASACDLFQCVCGDGILEGIRSDGVRKILYFQRCSREKESLNVCICPPTR